MKTLLRYILLLLFTGAFLFSCREDELDPWKDFREGNGAMVSYTEITSPIINFAEINSSAYQAKLADVNGNVAQFELFVVYKGDTAALKSISSFPADLSITASEIAAALTDAGFPTAVGDFNAGEKIDVFGRITDKKGTVYDVEDIGNDLLTNPGMRSMMRFNFFFSCPFTPSDAAGTYVVVADEWEDYAADGTEEVVVTSDATSVTVEGLYSNAYIGVVGHKTFPVKITVNVATGTATVAAQDAYDTTWWPGTYGVAKVDGTGFVFSCSGLITIDLQHRVALGTFGGGPYTITLQKL